MKMETPYGTLHGIIRHSTFANGYLDTVMINEASPLDLGFASLMPLYEITDQGRRSETPILFHTNGKLKSIPLQSRSLIKTSIGILPAELVTFYSSGELKRLFPSAGKLSGYWTEEMEAEEAPVCEWSTNHGSFSGNVISFQFYPSGSLQSITFWPDERQLFPTPVGDAEVRTGISFFESGAVQSIEPASPQPVSTPVGIIQAFESHPLGVTGDSNSLKWDESGRVHSLTTMNTAITVHKSGMVPKEYRPAVVTSFCEEADTELRGLHVAFTADTVRFGGSAEDEYLLAECTFSTKNLPFRAQVCCSH